MGITKAAKANSRMACFLLLAALVAVVAFIATLHRAAIDGEECHCEQGGVGYFEFHGDESCKEDEVEVCNLEVGKLILWGTISACCFGIAVLATMANPPR